MYFDENNPRSAGLLIIGHIYCPSQTMFDIEGGDSFPALGILHVYFMLFNTEKPFQVKISDFSIKIKKIMQILSLQLTLNIS